MLGSKASPGLNKANKQKTQDLSKVGSKDGKSSAAQNYFVANRLDHLIELVEDAQAATLSAYKEIAERLRDTPADNTPALPSSDWPRQVQFQLTIKRLYDLDTVEQTFGAQLFVTMRWECPSTEDPPSPEDDDGDWVPLWTPKYRIKSLVNEQLKIEQYTTTTEDGVTYCVAEVDHLAIISEELELEAFPVDCQDLTIELESSIPAERVMWVPIKGNDDIPQVRLHADTCLFNDFALLQECQFIYNLYVAKIGQKRTSSMLTKVKVVRSATNYLLNVALMVLLLGSFVLCPWALHPGDVPSRFSVDFSLILTMVAFKLVLASMLPPISYMTMLDIYVLVGFLFMGTVMVIHAVLPTFYIPTVDYPILTEPPVEERPYEEDLIAADIIAFYSCSGVWVLFNVGYAAYFKIVQLRGRSRFLQTALTQQQHFDKAHDEEIDRGTDRMIVYRGTNNTPNEE